MRDRSRKLCWPRNGWGQQNKTEHGGDATCGPSRYAAATSSRARSTCGDAGRKAGHFHQVGTVVWSDRERKERRPQPTDRQLRTLMKMAGLGEKPGPASKSRRGKDLQQSRAIHCQSCLWRLMGDLRTPYIYVRNSKQETAVHSKERMAQDWLGRYMGRRSPDIVSQTSAVNTDSAVEKFVAAMNRHSGAIACPRNAS